MVNWKRFLRQSDLQENWERIKQELLTGSYKPRPVRRVEIPKPDGGVRLLGIPTVLDRLIQQALHQTLNLIFDPGFSENSYGAGARSRECSRHGNIYKRGSGT